MRLTVAAGGTSWLLMNGAMAVWNSYLPLMQRERYADLAGLLLPVLQQLLEVGMQASPMQTPSTQPPCGSAVPPVDMFFGE